MTDPDAIAREIRKRERRDLDLLADQLRFEHRNRTECVTCGATLQTGRCPWSKPGTDPSVDGLIYCEWPRVRRPGDPAFRLNTKRA